MSKEALIMVIGILVFFTSIAGIPSDWKEYIFKFSGVVLVIVGYILRRAAYLRSIDRGNGERGGDSFVENSSSEYTSSVHNGNNRHNV